ncbi:SET domain-containing protein-lysine N-methyltransferase [Mesorhizobium sp.]|uniref:SET domain-containing protein-lysine N-methyltransferase n=1 Tax=Mesorhizobium sp. TaxID=1871066 RepID=UPI000FE9BF4D|nr:SET domain-containing protein-lysine N-methyltransferase [Mesorhizobium sp.]RWA83659.1 MAG: SET domain-containing protein-lysine N-methyltransferase [Mesorhizobium sp.]
MLDPQNAHTKVDNVLERTSALYVKKVPRKGRGVFANLHFQIGDTIARAPTWGFGDVEKHLLDRTGLFEYYFVRNDRQLSNDRAAGYVVFGLISLVNHSFHPNAQIVWTDEDTGGWARIVAIKDINVDEEITHRYTNISAYPDTINFVE